MKITDARVIVGSLGRNFVTLKVETDAGVDSVGDATLNGRELAVASFLQDHVRPLLIGCPPHRGQLAVPAQGQLLGPRPVTNTAIAAVGMALWDLEAKALGAPVHELLGGRSRDQAIRPVEADADAVKLFPACATLER